MYNGVTLKAEYSKPSLPSDCIIIFEHTVPNMTKNMAKCCAWKFSWITLKLFYFLMPNIITILCHFTEVWNKSKWNWSCLKKRWTKDTWLACIQVKPPHLHFGEAAMFGLGNHVHVYNEQSHPKFCCNYRPALVVQKVDSAIKNLWPNHWIVIYLSGR